MGFLNFLRRRPPNRDIVGRVLEVDRADIMRHYEILKESEELVYSSTNFETVLRRYDQMLDEIAYIGSYEELRGPEYVKKCGIALKTPENTFKKLWETMREQMPNILCGAVDRCLDAEIDAALKLKTARGQEARVLSFVDKIQGLDGVPVAVLKYVGSLPVADALREPAVMVTCRACGHKFRARPHAFKGWMLACPKCGQRLRVNTSGRGSFS